MVLLMEITNRAEFFIGKQIDGVWHTGIVAFGQEFFFGGMGIESCAPVR